MIGGIPETQEMLDFCAEHGIVADIELIRGDEINEAWERMVKGDVKYRFVIDSATLAQLSAATKGTPPFRRADAKARFKLLAPGDR